ncbi:MAG: GtrA family protein [Lachnospiraceae bacterium]|jgi:putative flippase GtrA|nr:GtrA family protein [Lachnospiraceae bacterium]
MFSSVNKENKIRIKKLKDLFINYETISYFVCGVLTTLVDWASFWLMDEQWQADYRISTALSWMAAVVFAYVVNKLIVFRNFRFGPSYLWKEWWAFFAARAFSGILVMILMIVLVDMLSWGKFYIGGLKAGLYLAKAVVSAVNLIVNYIFSKLWIFKKT